MHIVRAHWSASFNNDSMLTTESNALHSSLFSLSLSLHILPPTSPLPPSLLHPPPSLPPHRCWAPPHASTEELLPLSQAAESYQDQLPLPHQPPSGSPVKGAQSPLASEPLLCCTSEQYSCASGLGWPPVAACPPSALVPRTLEVLQAFEEGARRVWWWVWWRSWCWLFPCG